MGGAWRNLNEQELKTMKSLLTALLLSPLAALHAADTFLVEDGQPRAEIVISDKPQRSTRLAAQELQDGIQKISSARLPIVTQPTSGAVHVFVGQSEHTERLKVTAEGLKEGAFRMVSGADWLALIGDDTEFTPIEPWAKHNAEIVSGKAQAEWEKITGATWGLPNILMYKGRFSMPGDVGRPTAQAAEKPVPLQMWDYDERGSFNAVIGFLSRLGARWYLSLIHISEPTRPY